MKKILVLGASGFMGRNIAERFYGNVGYEVHTVGLKNTIPYEGHPVFRTCDLTNKTHVEDLFNTVKPDVVIQAAAVTSGSKDITQRPYLHVTDNAVMNALILQACYDHNVQHFVFLSCGVMYHPGEEPRREKDFQENVPLVPAYFGVGWTKIYVEKLCEFYSRLGRTRHTVIRHSNTFGPWDKYDYERSHMFGATVRKVMDAKDGDTITVWGNGTDTARDLIHVDEVVDFIEIVLALQSPPAFDLVNIGYGEAITVEEVVRSIIRASGKDIKIVYDTSKPSIPTKLALNYLHAFHDYGWSPKRSFNASVYKTIEWYRNQYGEFL